MRIEGSRPLITGAARGIGRVFVEAFLAAGADKIYAGVRNEGSGESLAALDPRVVPVVVDTTDTGQVAAAAAQAGDVDILVNNAGVLFYADFVGAETLNHARAEIEVNYFGPLNMARAFAPGLEARGGAIVNVLSVASLVYVPQVGSYNASKAAARSMTEGLRHELTPRGVRVYAVYAGGYATEMHPDLNIRAMLNPPTLLTGAVLDALSGDEPLDVFPDAMSQGAAKSVGLLAA